MTEIIGNFADITADRLDFNGRVHILTTLALGFLQTKAFLMSLFSASGSKAVGTQKSGSNGAWPRTSNMFVLGFK